MEGWHLLSIKLAMQWNESILISCVLYPNGGNEYCLMMVNQFTKWVDCVPLPSQKAEVTANAIDTFLQCSVTHYSCSLTKDATLTVNCSRQYAKL
ncbi:hypothetical protein DPMN_169710 [Dreissena polymorpha]|uniref:Uncharacterized protein n=1 Tax=Dreissena polymorpha TaxID=45954 RepID=A0A9D4DYE3_DREPO|nr:hypothetical protein DPMN_169710 [Dreissena polymorpha]